MRFPLTATLIASLASAATAAADNPHWKLAFQDDFDRPELGADWLVAGGKARIENGRLFLTGGGATVLVDRPFAPDVRIEFTAEANPDAPPCDLSVALGANPRWGYHYLLAFGGHSNRANQIVGGGPGVRDDNPPFLIEHGKTYTLAAAKEGPKLTYVVNGTKILEMIDPDPVGGPGFDRVGVVTWNGMYVDRVRVYERTSPAEGGPVVLHAMPDLGFRWTDRQIQCPITVDPAVREVAEAYNRRQYDRALQLLNSAPSDLSALVLRSYVLGDVAYDESPQDMTGLAKAARELAEKPDATEKVKDFARAAEWFSGLSVVSRNRVAAIRLNAMGPDHNPFYYKAKLYETRYYYATALEGASRRRIEESQQMFRELLAVWPDHLGLRELTGERVPWGPELTRPESDGPAWARHLQEVFARHQAVLNWWFTKRQGSLGQLGGGWGDDVEILRGWVPAACISSACEPAIAGIERLAEGVWHHALRDGYSPDRGDVEHSAEPSADALPTMIFLRYGDPLWVERNLQSAKTIRERFMAVNDRGRLQFLSAEFGADGVRRGPAAGGDTGYHARAMKHFIWLAWYGIPEARDVFLEWCETWREATMARIGTKPPGVIPASIFFPSGGIDPPTGKPWYDDQSHYYGFTGLPTMVVESFLAAYSLSDDPKYLDAAATVLDMSTVGPLRSNNPSLPPDHIDNLLAQVAHQAGPPILSTYHWLTGDTAYDEYLFKLAQTPAQRYLANRQLDEYLAGFTGLAERLRYNWAQRTSEVLQTDRAGLEGSEAVMAAYTGAVRDLRDAATPTFGVTWITPDLNFAAAVTESTPRRLRARVYNFNPTAERIGLRPWALQPGAYRVQCGEPVAGERPGQYRYTWESVRDVDHLHRAEPVWIDVPPGKEWVVDLRLREPIDRPSPLPDLAIAARDVRQEPDRLVITIHNIGATVAGSFDVVVEEKRGDDWEHLAAQSVDGLPAIRDFEPVRHEMSFPVKAKRPIRVRLDSGEVLEELCEENNTVELGR